MTYPQQGDYGGPELVPGALRLYRHYRLHGAWLTSTITTREEVKPGINKAQCLAQSSARADKNCPQCKGKGKYVIVVPNPNANSIYRSFTDDLELDNFSLSGLDHTTQVEKECDCLTEHPAPKRECQCGFYASYDPRTDFFEEYIRQVSAHPGSAFGADIPPVFAVVEATGRVLMGKTGVRAEKMRVVAMCIDVEHAAIGYRNPMLGMDQFSYSRWQGHGRGYISSSLNSKENRGDPGAGFSDTLQQYADALKALQFVYSARSYGIDMDGMIRDYPKQDISHLVKGASNG